MSLKELGQKYKTDKVDNHHTYNGMSYCDIYERYLSKNRLQVKTFVEIGIRDGCSLRMWKEYFPNAHIYGIDIDPRCKQFEEDRITCFIGDQNNEEFLLKIKEEIGEYDVLLDDGSHITEHQIKTFNNLYENCKENGFYIIEDLQNSYEEILNHHNLRNIWPGMKYNEINDSLKNFRSKFVDFREAKIKDLDFYRANKLFSIHNYPMILIFENFKC